MLLSGREREVLALVASGLSDREIAEQLVLSPHTVHRHVANIRHKLGRGSRTAAVAEARAWACSEADHPNGPSLLEMAGSSDALQLVAAYRRRRGDRHPTRRTVAAARLPGRAHSRFSTTRFCGSASGPDCAHAARSCSAGARGRTVEIGSGTGLNLPYYPDDLDELVLTEPDAAMRCRLGADAAPQRPSGTRLDARAERLPFADGSVDTVVSTFVLCTVDAPDLALREIVRVLAARRSAALHRARPL